MAAAATMTSAGGLLAMLNEDQPALKLHQLTSMTTDDIVRASRLLDNEIRILKEELQRTSLESDSFREKIKENQEKIKLNKQLPYLVGNIVEILEMNPEEEAEEDGANIDLDSQRKGKCVVLKTSTRQALDRGAALLKVDKLVTGHNVDDIAETVLLNILRGDIARLGRCTSITTGEDGPIPRCKPFKYTYEKEIVMYAYFKKLDYFSTECICRLVKKKLFLRYDGIVGCSSFRGY